MIRSTRHVAVALVCGAWITTALTGCDYWPPALHAQIEQLRAEAQAAAADKALLQNQLNAANKAKEELQTRVEDMTRINKEKSSMIANLERALTAERERAAKLTKGSAPKAKPTPKPSVKPSHKPSPKPPAKTPPKKKSSALPPKRVSDLNGPAGLVLVAMRMTPG
jgi:outer membrane biosynthesis protein TonB